MTETNWRRVASIYERLLNLIEEGVTYYTRAKEIRRNPEWAPNRPIRAELKLSRVNQKVDRAQGELLDALHIVREDGEDSPHPLAPRSAAYVIPVLEAEADRREAEARRQRTK